MELELFFIALYKHDAPQHVVAGPFIDMWEAMEKAKTHERINHYPHVVMKASLHLERVT